MHPPTAAVLNTTTRPPTPLCGWWARARPETGRQVKKARTLGGERVGRGGGALGITLLKAASQQPPCPSGEQPGRSASPARCPTCSSARPSFLHASHRKVSKVTICAARNPLESSLPFAEAKEFMVKPELRKRGSLLSQLFLENCQLTKNFETLFVS
jgi:hypothetical protein